MTHTVEPFADADPPRRSRQLAMTNMLVGIAIAALGAPVPGMGFVGGGFVGFGLFGWFAFNNQIDGLEVGADE